MRGDIVQRLRGRYPIGPMLPNGAPEFGWREFDGILTKDHGIIPAPPIMEEAAQDIERLRRVIYESIEGACECDTCCLLRDALLDEYPAISYCNDCRACFDSSSTQCPKCESTNISLEVPCA